MPSTNTYSNTPNIFAMTGGSGTANPTQFMNYGYGLPPGYTPQSGGGSSVDANGQPIRPTYQPGYNPYTESTAAGVQNQLNGIGTDQSGLNEFEQQAERTGPSAWANLANQQNTQQAGINRQQAAREAGAQGAQAQDQLAMSGGLSSGARERTTRDAGRNYLGMSQNIQQQQGQNQLQIGVNDEQNRIQQLGALPGMENANAQVQLSKLQTGTQAQQFDIGQQTGETERQNAFNSNTYNQQMQAWGAGQQANATAASGKK